MFASLLMTMRRIPEREFETRKDLRGERIFSIDPDDTKDVDDALSVKVNDDGTYDIGIHVADVSFFVKPNTPLDRDARKRATSVYLVQRVVPMLPPALSEQLCSLLPGDDRLAFSVILTLDNDAKVLKKSFSKTIIRSAAKLAYSDVQRVINGQSLGDSVVDSEHKASDVEKDILILQSLANKLTARRFHNGALRLNIPTLTFTLDENGRPSDCGQSQRTDAQTLVKEVWQSHFWKCLDVLTYSCIVHDTY
jgi:protein SSD1